MRLTRKTLRKMITESLLKETRLQKKDFEMFKKGVPSIDQAYYVHWVPQNVYGPGIPNLHFTDLEPVIGSIMKREHSFNLVDPAGQTTIPHYSEWGPVGIVVQGVVTYGEVRDVSSSPSQTPSGTRYYPSEVDMDGRHTPGLRFDPKVAFSKNVWDSSGNFQGIEPYDINSDTFLNHIPDFIYAGAEFIVKAQSLAGIVLHTQSEYPRAYHDSHGEPGSLDEFTDDENITKVKNISNRLNIPLAVGHEQIGNLYRYLYSNNPRVN